jgi:hypothetical protein
MKPHEEGKREWSFAATQRDRDQPGQNMGTVQIKQYDGEQQVHIQLSKTNRNGFKTFMVRGIKPAQIEDFKTFAERQADINSALFRSTLQWNNQPDGDAKRSAWNKLNGQWLNAFKASKSGRKSTSKPARGLLDLPTRTPARAERTTETIIKEFFK